MSGLLINEIMKLSRNRKVYAYMLAVLLVNLLPVLLTLLVRMKTMDGQSYPSTLWGFTVAWIIPLFLVILASEMLTEEYASGTLSLSLIHPVSRFQLFAAKALALLLFILFASLFALLLGYALGTLIFGWGTGFMMRGVSYTVQEGIRITVGSYLLAAAPLWSFSMLVMFLAVLLSSSASVVGAATGILLVSFVLDLLAAEISPWLISAYFTAFPEQFLSPSWSGPAYSLVFIAVHGLLFFLAGYQLIAKRDFTR
jgi:ABC-2 type transport system permease protein